MSELHVVEPGWSTTIQDGGRPGYAHLGVSCSGALDRERAALVNRLVGNPDFTAVLETAGGLRLRATGAAMVASSTDAAVRTLEPQEELTVGPDDTALWTYVAVRGGLAIPPVLGSRSQDSRSGLGPPPVTAGTRLPIGPDPGTPIVIDQAPLTIGDRPIPLWLGPRLDWFVTGALERLVGGAWTVSADVSRVGVRLDGSPIERSRHDELASEGLTLGAVQVPADGRPVVMLADHPTTGGYPVIAVVDPSSLGVVARARPGTALLFTLAR